MQTMRSQTFKSIEEVADRVNNSLEKCSLNKGFSKAILACAFAEHDLLITPSISIQQKDTCSQQDLMYKVFPIYFPAGESVLAKKMPGQERVKERREKDK